MDLFWITRNREISHYGILKALHDISIWLLLFSSKLFPSARPPPPKSLPPTERERVVGMIFSFAICLHKLGVVVVLFMSLAGTSSNHLGVEGGGGSNNTPFHVFIGDSPLS